VAPPVVSVVIPTRGRARLLSRAVGSALGQTYRPLEVVVVVDGPDAPTVAALEAAGDPRLRWRVAERPRGGSAARNAGVREARGEWVALLDDDDEWLPSKLETQMADLAASRAPEPVGFGQVVIRTPTFEYLSPRRPPGPGEPMSEYLFVRRGLFAGEGNVGATTIVTRTRLLERLPFDESLRRHQDWDWILRAAAEPGVAFVYSAGPLAVYHDDRGRVRVSADRAWRTSFDWARASRARMTGRAYAAFLLVQVAALAGKSGDLRALGVILREAVRHGRPRLADLSLFCGVSLLSPGVRERLRALRHGRGRERRGGPARAGRAA
jgi:glycosyltransferase involved in cell wall biosynthesis